MVTGKLIDGAFHVGDDDEILPGNFNGRIRGLQTHKTQITKAIPGSRVAININGVSHHELVRGLVVCNPGTYDISQRIECSYRHLSTSDFPLKHNCEVKIFLWIQSDDCSSTCAGAGGNLRGEQGWLQLFLRDPIVAARNDPFILRRPSPAATIGGGIILEPFSKKRHKRMDPQNLARLKTLASGTPRDILYDLLMSHPPLLVSALFDYSKLESIVFESTLAEMEEAGQLVLINKEGADLDTKTKLTSTDKWEILLSQLSSVLDEYHTKNRLRTGIPPEVLRARLDSQPDIYLKLLEVALDRRLIMRVDKLFADPAFSVSLSNSEQKLIQKILESFRSRAENPPGRKEVEQIGSQELLQFLLDTHKLVSVSADVLLEFEMYSDWVKAVEKKLRDNEAVSVSSIRDRLKTSRKYALALLEHLDAIGTTYREGDFRKLRD